MKRHYDMLFITHLPAFYKVNLYNHIAKRASVFVIFVSDASTIRTADFTQASFEFDYCILNQADFEKRNVLASLGKLIKQLKKLSFNKLIVGGWDLPEFWLAVFYSKKASNQLALESSVFESRIEGFRCWIKKLFLSRITLAYPSGEPHQALLQSLKFKGKVKTTKGVGLFTYQPRNLIPKTFAGKFLYVGRISSEKNIELLLGVFSQLPHFTLTLIGQGPLQAALEKVKSPNVTFLGHVANEKLGALYQEHDVLVLPSKREPWGLVVEEALFYGLPVIVSDKVGSGVDLVLNQKVGTAFESDNPMALTQSILWMCKHYQQCLVELAKLNFEAKDNYQVSQYLEACL